MPDPEDSSERFEIAAGLLDDDPQLLPDKHIFVELKAPWFQISDVLPQLDKNALRKHRQQMAQQSVQPDRREDAAPG